MTPTKERRGEARQSRTVRFTFFYAQQQSLVTTDNLSRSGAFLRSGLSFPTGTLLVLEAADQPFADKVRLLGKVVHARRGFPVKGRNAGMGVRWMRAYSNEGAGLLHKFLREVLHLEEGISQSLARGATGEAVYDFPQITVDEPQPSGGDAIPAGDSLGMRKLRMAERGRYSVDVAVVYSVDNMHYRGRVRTLGSDGISIVASGAVPMAFSRVTVRYPVGQGRTGERVLLFGEVDLSVEQTEPGEGPCFNLRLTGLDELDSPGIFRAHLRDLDRTSERA